MKSQAKQRAPLSEDPLLERFLETIQYRAHYAQSLEDQLTQKKMSLCDFASGHEYFGLHFQKGKWILREWAPNAGAMYLVGDFSNWEISDEFSFHKIEETGVWELSLAEDAIHHEDLYHLSIQWPGGKGQRLPAYVRRVVQDKKSHIFSAQIWKPQNSYQWKHPDFVREDRAPLIYEAHIGMAQETEGVGSYFEFEEKVLPRIIQAGYNTIQLMAIMEHPYYGSFGYHVSNFFSASSRFGTPDELKSLIDAIHGAGLAVIIDLVHSHAVKNEVEGLSRFDGTPFQYFHDGDRGNHSAWDSRCFNYGKSEVMHFLLSNCRFWIDEYKVDGFRFDGITSMIYLDHGLGEAFTSYDQYFNSQQIDQDAVAYLTLANKLIHELKPSAMTIAEDVSGMPGLGAPIEEGGCGFDYRLAMGVPDCWFKMMKEISDEHWPIGKLWYELTNHRQDEQIISYVECHDQAIVGGKTMIFQLIDSDMYTGMRISDESMIVDRGMALHKMARLATLAAAGHGYLNFIGNEFGHPEWVDFPRKENDWSYKHARRLWSLRDDPELRFHLLADFDQAMIALFSGKEKLIKNNSANFVFIHEEKKILAFERGGYYFIFNFHHNQSFTDHEIPVPQGNYQLCLDTDEKRFGGHVRLPTDQKYQSAPQKGNPDQHQIQLYLPSRTALVLKTLTSV